jgi:hypothetical protein
VSFDLGAPTPGANTIRLLRAKLTEAGTLQVLFDAFDHRLRTNGYLAMALRQAQDGSPGSGIAGPTARSSA